MHSCCTCTGVAMIQHRLSSNSNTTGIYRPIPVQDTGPGNRLKLNILDKTELLWSGTRRWLHSGLIAYTFPSLQLADVNVITPKQHVRVLGVVVSADLSLEKHVSTQYDLLPPSSSIPDYVISGGCSPRSLRRHLSTTPL